MNRSELYFTAFGLAAPQGSKRYVGNGVMIEASKKVGPWRENVKAAVHQAWIATGDNSKFSDPVEIRATFYLPRPKTVKRPLPSVPPDLDKLERGLFDALTLAGAWADDSLVVRSHASKLYCDDVKDAGVRVSIRTIEVADSEK